jgi:hypothetical protein
MKVIGKLTLAVLVTSCFHGTAFGQEIFEQRVYKRVPPALTDTSRSVVIERRVINEPKTYIESDADLVKRSNYVKRLDDMSEQISSAHSKGWLTDAQFNDLSNWHQSVAKEELALRQSGAGTVKASDVDLVEKHMTGLAYAINKNIDANAK